MRCTLVLQHLCRLTKLHKGHLELYADILRHAAVRHTCAHHRAYRPTHGVSHNSACCSSISLSRLCYTQFQHICTHITSTHIHTHPHICTHINTYAHTSTINTPYLLCQVLHTPRPCLYMSFPFGEAQVVHSLYTSTAKGPHRSADATLKILLAA